MKALWTEPRINFDGRFWQLKDAAMEPKPFQKPHPPIWFGASHPDALRRAVKYGNGFLRSRVVHDETVRRAGADRAAGARRAGPQRRTFKIGKRVYIASTMMPNARRPCDVAQTLHAGVVAARRPRGSSRSPRM